MKKLEKINKITGKKKKKEKAITYGIDDEEQQVLIDPIDQSVENQWLEKTWYNKLIELIKPTEIK